MKASSFGLEKEFGSTFGKPEIDPSKTTLWYALQVRNRFEKTVARNLQAKGYDEFLPMLIRVSRWSDRLKRIELPLFPGYVFCKFDPAARLPILMMPGVTGIVGSGKALLPVSERELDAVRKVVTSGNHFDCFGFLEVGQRVVVQYGPLAGVEGIVATVRNTHHLVISVQLLQRSVAVEIDPHCVKPVTRPAETMMQHRIPHLHHPSEFLRRPA